MNPSSDEQYEKIADGLATIGYACIDHFLNPTEVDAILKAEEFSDGLSSFKKAGIGQVKQINEGIRGDYIQWIDRTKASKAVDVYLQKLNALMLNINQSLFLSLKDYEVHSTIYPAGSYYKRHLDQFKATDHRILSVICYLNENWTSSDGGQLRMHLPEGAEDIFPVSGRLVCFRSDMIEHEVLPATRSRLSLTGWMLDQFADLGHF